MPRNPQMRVMSSPISAQQTAAPTQPVHPALAFARRMAAQAQGIYAAGSFPALLGKPGWSYQAVNTSPKMGPVPRMAQGSGQTAAPDVRQDGTQYGGFLSNQEYQPAPFDYEPGQTDNFLARIDKRGVGGVDGLALVGTYRAHDFTVAEYEQHNRRSADNWQVMSYPPNWRKLLGAQQVAKYNLYNQVAMARPLQQNDYFLGYQMTLAQNAGVGGYSLGRPLGS